MLLSLLLLALLWQPAQATSGVPPLEVLEAEVVVQKLKSHTGSDIRPPGAVVNGQCTRL